MLLHPQIDEALKKRQVLKVIIGLSNFNVKDIISKAQAAEIGGATYIDIAANPKIVKEVKKVTNIPVCVSSIDIDELYHCFIAGADILEIGNFDIFYDQNIAFTRQQITDLAVELQDRAPKAAICVTIPHSLDIGEQILLAKKLEDLKIAIIQTEGMSSKNYVNNYLLNSVYNASAALSNTYIFSKYVNTPILSASGLNALTAPIALVYGASGIGIGSFLNSADTVIDMTISIQDIVDIIHGYHLVNFQLHNYFLYKFTPDLQSDELIIHHRS